MPPAIIGGIIAATAFASTVTTIVQAANSGGGSATGPKAPTLADPEVEAARRRRLLTASTQGRSSTVLAGAKSGSLEVENSTILGAAA